MDLRTRKFLYNYYPYIQYLPISEQKIIEYMNAGLHQKAVSKILGVTQGAISSRLNRLKERLMFIREWKKFKIDDEDLKLLDPFSVALLKSLAETTCQSETAHILNRVFGLSGQDKMNQVKVRHRFNKCLKEIGWVAKKNPRLKEYLEYFQFINDNLYILHEVRLPHFDRK